MERLLSIPKSIDNPNLILKNFEKVLVGSIENESAEVRAESSSNISSPKIIPVSSKRKITSAKREKEITTILEGTRFSSIQQTNLPGMTTNSKPHQKKRSLTRKTAIITPFPTSPLSLWNIRNEVTYPKNSSVQVSEVSAPSSPRKKIRKTRVLSPASSLINIKPHKDASLLGLKNQYRSPTFSRTATPPIASSRNPVKRLDIDSKIQSILGLSGTSTEKSALNFSAKIDAKKLEEDEKLLEQKRKFARELLEKQMRPVVPVLKRAVKPIENNGKENKKFLTVKSIQEPIAHPKPLPDPKKSEEVRKYMKEKKMQDVKRKKMLKEEEGKKKELIASSLKRLDEERRIQRQEELLKKSKILEEENFKAIKRIVEKDIKTITINPSPTINQTTSHALASEAPSILVQTNLADLVKLSTIPPAPLLESQMAEKNQTCTDSKEKSMIAPNELARKSFHEVEFPKNTQANAHEASKLDESLKPSAESSLEPNLNSENPLETNQLPKELVAKLDSLAQGVIAIGEKIRKLEQNNMDKKKKEQDEIIDGKLIEKSTIKEDAQLITINAHSKKDDNVGVGSFAEFSKKRKDFERIHDAALVIQAFYKKQKRKGSMQKQKVSIQATNHKNSKNNQEPHLMNMFIECNRKPDSPSRITPVLLNQPKKAADNSPVSFRTLPEIKNYKDLEKPQNHIESKKDCPEESKMMAMFEFANKKIESPPKSKSYLFEEIITTKKDEHVIIPTAPKSSVGILEESLLMDMLESVNKKPQNSMEISAIATLNHVQPLEAKIEENLIFQPPPVSKERVSIVDLFVKKISATAFSVDHRNQLEPLIEKASLPESRIETAVEKEIKNGQEAIPPTQLDLISDLSNLVDLNLSTFSKTVSKCIQTEMDISDVSELSEPLAAHISSNNQSNISHQLNTKKETTCNLNDVYTHNDYNDSFESLSSSSISFKKPFSPPPFKVSIKRAKPLFGEALRRNLMGFEGQGKLAPESLGQRHDYELNCLEATNECIIQADELRINRESALWKQESAAILQLYISDRKNREAELEAAKLQKLNTIANATNTHNYDSSFESFQDVHYTPKVKLTKSSSKSSIIEEDIDYGIYEKPTNKNDINSIPKKKKNSIKEKSSIRQLLDSVVETIPKAIKKAPPPIFQDSIEPPRITLKDADLNFKLKMAKSDMEAVLKSKDLSKKATRKKLSYDSEEIISENIPFSNSSSIHSSISEHLPSDISQSKNRKVKEETELYEDESFYSADSDFESDTSSTTPTEIDDLLTVDQLLKNATKKLNAKVLSKKEKSLKSISDNYEKLKENAQWNQRLKLEGLRISKLVSELMKDASSRPTNGAENISVNLKDDSESDNQVVEKAKRHINQEKSLNSLSLQVETLQEELNMHQENIMYFGQPDSPKKKNLLIIPTTEPIEVPIENSKIIPDTRIENSKIINEPDEMSSMIIKLAGQVLKMQAEIDAKKAFVNSARKLENDILIQKQLKVISGLNQEMLYLNQSERLIDPAILEIAKSTVSKKDLLTDPIIEASKVETLLSTVGEQPDVVHIVTDLAVEIKSPVMNETTSLQSLTSNPILAKIIEPNVNNLQPGSNEHATVIHAAVDLTESLAEMKPLVIEEDNSLQSLASDSNIETKSNVYLKSNDTEDPTSDLISEKFSELEIISENIVSQTESADSDKLFQYEDDFETDDESSSNLPILPASSSNSKSPLKNTPEYVDLITESIFNELLENTFNSIGTSLSPKIGIPCPDLNPEPKNEAEMSTQPVCTFPSDMDQGVEILFKELDLIFPAGSKYSEPPPIPLSYLEGLLPSSVASLLVDCLESAIVAQFAKHLAYNQPNRMFYEKKLMKPPPISSSRLIHVCKNQLNEWIEYPKSHGTDMNLLLEEVVKVEGKSYCDLQEDIARVKLEISDSIYNDLINGTVDCLFNVTT